MTYNKIANGRQRLIPILIGLVFLYFAVILVRVTSQSTLFQKKDRINIVFYNGQATVISLGLADQVHYVFAFDGDTPVLVPGGYDRYRVSALGRLSQLEHKPQLIEKTFSSAMSAYVTYYFYNPGGKPPDSYKTAVLSPKWQSDASVIDRAYLFWLLFNKRKSDFAELRTNFLKERFETVFFAEEQFFKKYSGFFYEQYVRNEAKTVKIVYTIYSSAKTISRILDGEGARVVDLTRGEKKAADCVIIDSSQRSSQTAKYIGQIFRCAVRKGEVVGADIEVRLGGKVEKEWE